MLITGLISKHNHVTNFPRELLIFFWLTLVDFFLWSLISHHMKEMMYTLSHVPDVDVEESNAECGAQNSSSTIFNFSQFFKS